MSSVAVVIDIYRVNTFANFKIFRTVGTGVAAVAFISPNNLDNYNTLCCFNLLTLLNYILYFFLFTV